MTRHAISRRKIPGDGEQRLRRLRPPLSSCVFLLSIFLSVAHSQHYERFTNPILAGFYPDPSICAVAGDFYLVTSTFSYFPGLPVFHSKDLVSWQLLGHAMNRPEQLTLDKQGVSRGLFAPSIRENNGIFYITCTLVDIGGNFVITATKPEGPWSNPVWIPQVDGIDPSLFFDDNGKAYIIYNSVAPDNKPLYNGHRTIRMYEFDAKTLAVVGNPKLLINGGVDLSKMPIWIEGPHIFKKDDFYYMICAEGGTGDQHSEVVFRSHSVDGPYIPFEGNPILTQRHLDPRRSNPITCTGHADFVQTPSGDWWSVFLGCRPYHPVEEQYYNTGRETFLAPVTWKNGWPRINPDHDEVQYSYPLPISPRVQAQRLYSGNFQFKDDFTTSTLDPNWIFLRTPHVKWYDLQQKKGTLALMLRSEDCSGNMNPSFLGHRQQHLVGEASVAMDFSAKSENEKAGMLIFYDEGHFYFLCKSVLDGGNVVQVFKSGGSANEQMEMLASRRIAKKRAETRIYLKIEARGETYAFFYGDSPGKWHVLADSIDAKFLSTRIAGGFVGCIYALYASSHGKASTTRASFDWFSYANKDTVYSMRSTENR